MKKSDLTLEKIVSNGISNGLQNFLPLLGAFVLWLLTCWIPYLNFGTTIALASLPIAISNGEKITPMQIFDAKYRKNIGSFSLLLLFLFAGMYASMIFGLPGLLMNNYLITQTLMNGNIGINTYIYVSYIGLAFLLIPMLVMYITWSQSVFLLLDKGTEPLESIKMSASLVHGKKWPIFGGVAIFDLACYIAFTVIMFIFGFINGLTHIEFTSWLPNFVMLVIMLLYVPFKLGTAGYVYNCLKNEKA